MWSGNVLTSFLLGLGKKRAVGVLERQQQNQIDAEAVEWIEKRVRRLVPRDSYQSYATDITQDVVQLLIEKGPWTEKDVRSAEGLISRIAVNVIREYWPPENPVWVPRLRPPRKNAIVRSTVHNAAERKVRIISQEALIDEHGRPHPELLDECPSKRLEMQQALEILATDLADDLLKIAEVVVAANLARVTEISVARKHGFTDADFWRGKRRFNAVLKKAKPLM